MRFMCDVYNKVAGHSDTYTVVAVGRKAARVELINRLDNETDEGSKGYDIVRITLVKE